MNTPKPTAEEALKARIDSLLELAPTVADTAETRLLKRAKLIPWHGDSDRIAEMFQVLREVRDHIDSTRQPEPVARGPGSHTTGHCDNKKLPTGCPLENRFCQYPECDRQPAPSRPVSPQMQDAFAVSPTLTDAGRLSPVVPEGWKLVPVKLTPHMGHVGDATLDDDGSMQCMWDNMLAAAPEPPKPEGGEVELAALEPMCAKCGQPTMHIGNICFACSRPSRNAAQQGERVAELERREKGMLTELHDVEQTLGKALGYPWFKDDQKNFPGATEVDGVCVGDHVPATLAIEAAAKIASLTRERDEARRELAEARGKALEAGGLTARQAVLEFDVLTSTAGMCDCEDCARRKRAIRIYLAALLYAPDASIRALATSSKGGEAK